MGGTLLFFLQILQFPARVPALGTLRTLGTQSSPCKLRGQKGT